MSWSGHRSRIQSSIVFQGVQGTGIAGVVEVAVLGARFDVELDVDARRRQGRGEALTTRPQLVALAHHDRRRWEAVAVAEAGERVRIGERRLAPGVSST